MGSLFPKALVAIASFAMLGGCLQETETSWIGVEFRSLYEEDRLVEAWIADWEHVARDDLGPNDGWNEHRFSTSFPCEDPHPEFHVVMRARDGFTNPILENKTWLIPDCHADKHWLTPDRQKTYTVLIDQEGKMNFYVCGAKDFAKPCPTRGPPLTPVSE